MLKKTLFLLLVSAAIIVTAYMVGVYQNNRAVPFPETKLMQQKLESSTQWLLNNEADILQQANPMLWWMLHEAEKITHDVRLAGLLVKYKQKYPAIQEGVWSPLFGAAPRSYLDSYSVNGLPYYNQHFIYALNCAQDIATNIPVVEEQNQPGFCHQANYIYRPACITHQLMGINFLRTQQCGLLANSDEVSQSLQNDIKVQLIWDIRVVDVYLQRVMMLLITGAEKDVKPIWLQQVLDRQLADGGWGDFAPIVELSSEKSLGFSSRILSIGRANSSFHATAQGVMILSTVLHNAR